MFELTLCASWRPAHDDWLNEWSSTPPVSSTMHALTLLPELLPELAVELDGLEHPAASRDTAPATATTFSAWRKRFSSFVPPPVGQEILGHPSAHTRPESPPGGASEECYRSVTRNGHEAVI